MAVAQAEAGAHLLGPSGMMDGQVRVIREALDAAGFVDVGILAYTAKYASAFYGPFREAVESQLVGDRKTYQQDGANVREALRELALDLEEGADLVMVKPAMAYLDVLRAVAEIADVPVAAYQVSGEYAMIEAAAANGWLDRERHHPGDAADAIRRAGADVVLSYWATEVAQRVGAGSNRRLRLRTSGSTLDTIATSRNRGRAQMSYDPGSPGIPAPVGQGWPGGQQYPGGYGQQPAARSRVGRTTAAGRHAGPAGPPGIAAASRPCSTSRSPASPRRA